MSGTGRAKVAGRGRKDTGHHPAKPESELVGHLRQVVGAVPVGELRDHGAHDRYGDDSERKLEELEGVGVVGDPGLPSPTAMASTTKTAIWLARTKPKVQLDNERISMMAGSSAAARRSASRARAHRRRQQRDRLHEDAGARAET